MTKKIKCPICGNTEAFYYDEKGFLHCLECSNKIPGEKIEGFKNKEPKKKKWWEKMLRKEKNIKKRR